MVASEPELFYNHYLFEQKTVLFWENINKQE